MFEAKITGVGLRHALGAVWHLFHSPPTPMTVKRDRLQVSKSLYEERERKVPRNKDVEKEPLPIFRFYEQGHGVHLMWAPRGHITFLMRVVERC